MAEKATAALQVAKNPTTTKPFQVGSLTERVNAAFDAISRRAYEIFEGNGCICGRELEDWFQAERELLHPVHIQVNETESAIEVKAEVPGFNEKELEVSVEPQRLVLSGKRETKKEENKGKTVYSETCLDQILRVVDLPAEVETEKIAATLKNGILELELTKVAKAHDVQIGAKAAA
ncbi:MAG TPA: Hsp20 family protein [Candidatus Baltobacteraceae bacterium]|nr:Hsp20 family protein [Candidatus Baltobacteraceae bacterium]